jgi:hypothetical protein
MLSDYQEKLANNKEIYLKVKVSTGADETGFLPKMADGTIRVALKAVPEKGRANQALINFLAGELELRKYQLKIVSGVGDRLKLIKISR